MSGSLGQVVAQLRSAIDTLHNAAVVARRAQADAEEAHAHYSQAAQGSSHPHLSGAVTESKTAGEKAGKLARLISEAADRIGNYLNAVAPGSAPTRQPTDSAAPSGEDLLTETVERESARKNVASFLSTMTRKVEDVQDNTQKSVAAAREAFTIIRGPKGPSGAQQAGTAAPTAGPSLGQRLLNEAPDAAGHLVVVGLVASIAVQRSVQSIRKGIARLRDRERTDRVQRPDPRDGTA
ncbi:hypothetical protein [Micromonospora parathelypteridis]|uniref:Uncharacterized protein n=1 Tax=Micromonospora parathelypteridis TaxID=1839617 RepID=A0A840VU51_9ACTN|nr:hypothetical protein [Micromonospora parathelypteridis]MBB5479506.1 hypothetical protein [Micromonospora parathelypteridis]GGO30294.1 hypothetical protein GCM10011576_57670 [Micromonospora parathelypteridis]